MTVTANSHNPSNQPGIWAVIPCAGTGSRSGSEGPKQYKMIAGKPMVLHTLQAFSSVRRLSGTLLVVSEQDSFFENASFGESSIFVHQCGGATRAASVCNGLKALRGLGAKDDDWVLVHDAARCLITQQQINALIDAGLTDQVGALLALPLPDTLKREEDGRVAETIARGDKWLAQTPQMFHVAELISAIEAAGDAVTDESSAMEFMGKRPLLVEGSAQNFKVTYPLDFALAESIFEARNRI